MAICEGNPLIIDGSPLKGLVQYDFDGFFVVSLNKLLNKQSVWCWIQTPWHSWHNILYSIFMNDDVIKWKHLQTVQMLVIWDAMALIVMSL